MSVEPQISQRRRRSRRAVWIIVLVTLLITVAILIVLSNPRETTLTWLAPGEVGHPPRPEFLRQLKYKFLQVTSPIWRRFEHDKISILIDANIFTATTSSIEKLNLGTPASTNVDGCRAWILSNAGMAGFNQSTRTNAEVKTVSRPRMQTGDGQQAQVSMVQSVPINFQPATVHAFSLQTNVGVVVDIVPKLQADSIKLAVATADTETNGWSADGSLMLITNLSIACRALIPNGGGLILEGSVGTNNGGTNYWFALSSTAIDGRGMPAKLK